MIMLEAGITRNNILLGILLAVVYTHTTTAWFYFSSLPVYLVVQLLSASTELWLLNHVYYINWSEGEINSCLNKHFIEPFSCFVDDSFCGH